MRNPELFQATSCKVGICLMNKFIPPPSYPFAVATPTTESPFGIAQLRLMAKPYSGQSLSQMYMGPGWLDPSGLACVVFITPNDLYPRRIRQIPECGFLAWRWNNTPSAPFSLSLAIKGGTPRPQMRWIRASSDPVVQAIRKHGQFFVNIISTAGQDSGWRKAIFKSEISFDAQDSTSALEYLWTFSVPGIEYSNIHEAFDPLRREYFNDEREDEIPMAPEPISDYWHTLSFKGPWEDDLGPRDRAIIEWGSAAFNARNRAAGMVQVIIDGRQLRQDPPIFNEDGSFAIKTSEAEKEELDQLLAHAPLFRNLFAKLAGPQPNAEAAKEAVVDIFFEPFALRELVTDALSIVDGIGNPDLCYALGETIKAALLDHRVTKAGTARPWFRNEPGKGLALEQLEIDLNAPIDAIRALWQDGLELMDLLDAGVRVGGKDFPMSHRDVYLALHDVAVDGTIEEAEARVFALAKEAREARQWTVPWGALVEVQFGPFVGVRIFEQDGEFSCHFVGENDRYFHVALGINGNPPSIKTHPIYKQTNSEDLTTVQENTHAEMALKLIAVATIRDFLVVEDRTTVFSHKIVKNAKGHSKPFTVIYLPRVRYSHIDPSGMPMDAEAIQRAKHAVVAHLRRVANASPAQRLLAMKYGITVPVGFTFVRPHERGGVEHREQVRIYRSRSASKMIFQALDTVPPGDRPEWFEFEKDCAKLLSGLGMEVVHQAANRKGDDGLDLYAVDREGQSWVVQCKCWSKPVGPEVVRELSGAIAIADQGAEKPSKGLIITTSTFTSGSVATAQKLGFDLIDGSKLAEMLAA